MTEQILNEIAEIRGTAELISVRHIFEVAEQNPDRYPGVSRIYRSNDQKQGRTKISKIIRESGKYRRWNSIHSAQAGATAVWMVI